MKVHFISIVKSNHPAGVMIRASLSIPMLLYLLVLKCRASLYKTGILKKTKVTVPVISIGNITMGGTGKTPLVEFVGRYLSEKGKKVVILSRGYRSDVMHHASPGSEVNDEHLVLSENLQDVPNLLGKDRVTNASIAIEDYGAECLILDDGFQHWKLERNLDIVVIDALNPFGFERLIPQGTLREPLRNLWRAHIFVLTHCDQCPQDRLVLIKQRLKHINDNAPIVETAHCPTQIESLGREWSRPFPASWLNGKSVYAFCALGNPESFKHTLKALGASIAKFDCFPDHHLYKHEELDRIINEAERLAVDAIITTQKDGVKIKSLKANPPIPPLTKGGKGGIIPLLMLKIEVRVLKGNDALEAALNACVNICNPRPQSAESLLIKG